MPPGRPCERRDAVREPWRGPRAVNQRVASFRPPTCWLRNRNPVTNHPRRRPARLRPGERDIRSVWYASVTHELGSKEPLVTRHTYTAIVEKEGDGYIALCPELDVASQGATIEEATANLREAVELFLECADPEEVARRVHTDVFVTRFEATVG